MCPHDTHLADHLSRVAELRRNQLLVKKTYGDGVHAAKAQKRSLFLKVLYLCRNIFKMPNQNPEQIARDKIDNLPEPDEIVSEIIENLEEGIARLRYPIQ